MKIAKYTFLVLLAVGGILLTVEGALIGLWRVWLSDDAPVFLQVMLPGMIVAMATAIGISALKGRREHTGGRSAGRAVDPPPEGRHAGLR
jgi:hypothetical protein